MIFFYASLTALAVITTVVLVLKKIKKDISILELILAVGYVFSFVFFFFGLLMHDNEYYTAIDPVDVECYIPFGEKHILTLLFYFIAFNISIALIWLKGNKLPPLAQVLSFSFLIIGTIISFLVFLQISEHNTESIDMYDKTDHILFFIFAPVVSLIISTSLIIQTVTNTMIVASQKTYSNKFLNRLNQFFAKKSNLPLWSIILIIPLLLLVTIVLILFGQDSNSLIKVFTETTTWRFSQQMHPPILDHKGHYLCTVAASGDPEIVKPLRFGKRNGNTIIVNRQLLIANAFEEMIQDFSPKLHRFIRGNYDKYGYNLSLKINTNRMSNLTYLLMKPLEWVFLLCLYLFCEKPEERIGRQYKF
ncbi:DUF6688 domain-containing protein [Flavobacterium piscisymbiosum]|uniref:Uncharacterized protein n=1 Tax=Flavobacterium piscisymbiosum TaxID=2893753 RepID=A0ABS8ME71_9FLAO|nr:DUF6688 family protein [Flavobacterium sp. F-30]MCC9063805.1 hypothetical protein [Flavobacterium sp. F-30]